MPITIHVHSRDTSQAWFMGEGNPSYLRDMLQTYLRRSTPMTNLEAKRLVRAIMDGQAVDLVLVDPQYCEGICHWLSQLGASLEVEGDTGEVFQPPTPR